jgi:lipopolysaccharide/colanic/teichoic acid biosynthesis glycosyltransferase
VSTVMRRPTSAGTAARPGARRVKRWLDVVVSLIALLLVAPVLAIVAVAVRVEGGPGVLFRQQRVGQHGRIFLLYKFRSLAPVAGEGDTTWSIDGDPRLGPVGRFIRATALDELPQLWNVLVGDMSLVGPRPERPYFVEQFSRTVPGYADRHLVPVGLTGLAVVEGMRGNTSIPERVAVDKRYVASWRLALDLVIIARTALMLASGAVAAPGRRRA